MDYDILPFFDLSYFEYVWWTTILKKFNKGGIQMNKKRLFIAFCVSVAILIVFGFVSTQTISAAECYIIKVVGSTPVATEPPGVIVKKGDCVVWFNASSTPIKVRFLDNKGCSIPVGFKEEATCFVTNWTSPGETMSLVLNEPGSYDFEISTKTDPEKKSPRKGIG